MGRHRYLTHPPTHPSIQHIHPPTHPFDPPTHPTTQPPTHPVKELRWRWDNGMSVPRIHPPRKGEKEEEEEEEEEEEDLFSTGRRKEEEEEEVDLSTCLLHQKLQVLDLCCRRRQAKERVGRDTHPPTHPPTHSM